MRTLQDMIWRAANAGACDDAILSLSRCASWAEVSEHPDCDEWLEWAIAVGLLEGIPALAAYKAVEGPAFAAYRAVQAPAWAAYQAAEGNAYDASMAVEEAAYAAYKAVQGNAFAAYKAVQGNAFAQLKAALLAHFNA